MQTTWRSKGRLLAPETSTAFACLRLGDLGPLSIEIR